MIGKIEVKTIFPLRITSVVISLFQIGELLFVSFFFFKSE